MNIGILCGGGDCPGLNAVIRGAVKALDRTDIRIFAYDLAKRLEKACELSQQEEEK